MRQGNKRDRADDGKDWRERPIDAGGIARAQVLTHIFVPQEPVWGWWCDTFLEERRPTRVDPFTQIFVPADDPWPTLPHGAPPRDSRLTEDQQAAYARSREAHVRACAVTLGLARCVISVLRIPTRCESTLCRRANMCTAERVGAEWRAYPGPAWPPCVSNWGRAGIVRPPVERLIDRLDLLIETRLTAMIGEPWSAAERIGLTWLPVEELQATLEASFQERRGVTPTPHANLSAP
jgi:hypothetical protein